MTKNPDFLPHRDADRLVLFVAFADMCLLDVGGPQTVFWAASHAQKAQNLPGYHCNIVSVTGGQIRAAEGIALETRPVTDFDGEPIATLMVACAFARTELVQPSKPLLQSLRATC